MKTNSSAPDYQGFRFPPAIISHAVWLSFRFSLSFRSGGRADDAQRGIVVTYETVRQWGLRIRPDLCQRIALSSPSLWGYVAYGRGLPHDQGQEAFPLASSGPG